MPQQVKQTLMTGLGDGYFQRMLEEETITTAPEYDTVTGTEVVPSLQSADTTMTFDSSPIYLSNKKHSDLGKLTDITMTLNAAYLPEGFAEWATGAIKMAEGIYGYNSNPIRKFFRFAFPATDEKGREIIYNFPKCQLEPVGINPNTETETKDAQITAYNIVGNALVYRPAGELAEDDVNDGMYFKADLRKPAVADAFDRDKLLELGWYDKVSLEACRKAGVDPAL